MSKTKRTYVNSGALPPYRVTESGHLRMIGKIQIKDEKAREEYAKAILEGKEITLLANEMQSKFKNCNEDKYLLLSFADVK